MSGIGPGVIRKRPPNSSSKEKVQYESRRVYRDTTTELRVACSSWRKWTTLYHGCSHRGIVTNCRQQQQRRGWNVWGATSDNVRVVRIANDSCSSACVDWLSMGTSPPTQYRLYRRRFLQVRRPDQQYQSTEGTAVLVFALKKKMQKNLTDKVRLQSFLVLYYGGR